MNRLKQVKDTNIKENYSPHAIRHGRIKGRPKRQSQTLGREGDSKETLVNAHFVIPDIISNIRQNVCRNRSVMPTTGKIDCAKKDFAIGTTCNDFIYHRITVISIIHGILLNQFRGTDKV